MSPFHCPREAASRIQSGLTAQESRYETRVECGHAYAVSKPYCRDKAGRRAADARQRNQCVHALGMTAWAGFIDVHIVGQRTAWYPRGRFIPRACEFWRRSKHGRCCPMADVRASCVTEFCKIICLRSSIGSFLHTTDNGGWVA